MVNALVDRKDLSAAVALNSATFNACRIIGPGIAGPLLVLVERGVIAADVVFAIATLAFVQFYIAMYFLPAKGAGGEGKISMALIRDMKDGMVYVWRDPGIWFLMVVLGATGLFIRPFMEMAPGYADLIFGLKAEGLATIVASIGAGAMVSSLWLARRGRTDAAGAGHPRRPRRPRSVDRRGRPPAGDTRRRPRRGDRRAALRAAKRGDPRGATRPDRRNRRLPL